MISRFAIRGAVRSISSLSQRARLAAAALGLGAAALIGGCASQLEIPAHLKPLSKDAMMLLGKKGMETNSQLFIRIFKEESELEIWKQRADGHFYHYKTYPICTWSGELGPKLAQGDKQAPEGFYSVPRTQMNPNSQFHLSFNLGFPNAYDKAMKRHGDFLMVHGKCKSAGCYAMTDALIEEIYAFAREAFIGGQDAFQVHAFPFRMTEANLARHANNKWMPFWQTLKEGYDHFEVSRKVPDIAICGRRYMVNAKVPPNMSKLDAEAACPRLERPPVMAFRPTGPPTQVVEERVTVPGPKTRAIANAPAPSTWTLPSSRPGLLSNQ